MSEELTEEQRKSLEMMLSAIAKPRLTAQQNAILTALTEDLSAQAEEIETLVKELSETIGDDKLTLVVLGAGMQLVLNCANGLARGYTEDDEDADYLNMRTDIGVAVCDLIYNTLASNQGLEQ